jgi:transposase
VQRWQGHRGKPRPVRSAADAAASADGGLHGETYPSTNSSKPASQTPKDDTAVTQSGTHGKGKMLNETRSGNTRTVESQQISPVGFCEECVEDLHKVPCEGYERRTQIDIVFEKVVTHIDAEIKPCPHCGTEARGPFPEAFCGPLQYGAGIKAYALNLLIAQMLSLKRVQQSLQTLLGQVISEATILKYVLILHLALENWEKTAIERLLTLPALHVDETSLRVDKKNHWIHVCSGGQITLKLLHKKRGLEAMAAIGVIPRYGGVIIHDCWASYLSYEHCGHGLCGAHLLRELTFIVEADGYAWAKNMKCLLQETCVRVAQRKRKKLTPRQYQNLQKRYRNIITRGEQELPPLPVRQSGKRGRIAKSDAHNLWERIKEHESAVLLFARDPHVAFTNNRAERDLRMSKVKQKVSGCFRKAQYAEAYCRISSYLQTMANRGYNPLVAIQLALSGQLYAETGE